MTAITFKNKKVTLRNNSSNPVFLGPCLLHKKSREEDYNFFFSYLKSKILNNYPSFDFSTLSFVTDGEHALVNSIYNNFPDSTKFRCHIHINKNIIYNLRKFNMDYQEKTNMKAKFNSFNSI